MQVLDPVSAILKYKSGPIWSIAPNATVYDALAVMAEREIGALLVKDGNNVVGLLSERDYARKIILLGRSSKETKVNEIMIAPPLTIGVGCSIDEAMKIMTESRVRHLPVIGDNGGALGIISLGDVVKWVIDSQEKTIEHLQSYIAGNA
jgi:CBS domain-containing protein